MIDRFKPIAVALLLAAVPASADTVSEEIDRGKLWNDCKPTRLLVEGLSDEAANIGLTKEAIEVAVRSRLRSARLYTLDWMEAAGTKLYVQVTVSSRAYGVDIYYQKWMLDAVTSLGVPGYTWISGSIGTHGANSSYILQIIAQEVDSFIDEYLRVNSDACGPPSVTNE